MFQLAFQDVPTLAGGKMGVMGVRGLWDSADARSGRESPAIDPWKAVFGRNVPTCVPTCSNFDLGVNTVLSSFIFARFWAKSEILLSLCQKIVQIRGVPTVPTFLYSGNFWQNYFFSLVTGGRQSWNLEHFPHTDTSIGPIAPSTARGAARCAPIAASR